MGIIFIIVVVVVMYWGMKNRLAVWILVLSLTSYLVLGRLFSLSVPHFPYIYIGRILLSLHYLCELEFM